ncbi:hypothetical protein KJ707_01750 [Patescibacteria group bacterium]|nr:hypothetical protein [Patescibacteria group bacterium]
MPKLSDKKLTLGQISLLSVEERVKIFEPIIKANAEQFTKIANTIAETASFAKSISSIASSFKLPNLDFIKDFQLPEIPIYEPPQLDITSFERYDPPVTIKKTQRELELEAREAYMTELQIQVLEQQLNLYKGMLAPQYDINTGVITFLGKQIEIPLNTKLEIVCRIVLKNLNNMKRKWSWDEIVETYRNNPDDYKPRQIYNAVRSINDKVAIETQVKDFFISKPFTTVQFNPKFLPK